MERKLHIAAVSILLIAMVVQPVVGVAQSWTFTNGPYRPHVVRDLSAAKVGSVQTIYAADAETLKVTTNGGTTWQNTGSIPMLNPVVVAVKPDNASILHVGVATALYLSTDGGANWSQPKVSEANLVPLRLAVSAYNTSVWFLGTDTTWYGSTWWVTSLYRTSDGGTNWAAINYFRDNARTNIYDIAFNPSTNDVWVGGTRKPLEQTPDMTDESGYSIHQKGVWYSSDGGVNWTFRGTMSSTDCNVTSLAYSAGGSNLLFAVTTKDASGTRKAILYQSTDGTSWSQTADLYDKIGVGLVRALRVNPSDYTNLIAATDKGFAISTNRGDDWSLSNNNLEDLQTAYQVLFSRLDVDTVYLGADPTVYMSANQGDDWSDGKGIYNFMNTGGFAINNGTAHGVSSSYSGLSLFSSGAWDLTPKIVGEIGRASCRERVYENV
jgi:hypothetical protein